MANWEMDGFGSMADGGPKFRVHVICCDEDQPDTNLVEDQSTLSRHNFRYHALIQEEKHRSCTEFDRDGVRHLWGLSMWVTIYNGPQFQSRSEAERDAGRFLVDKARCEPGC